jgi:hypothetical protein
MLRFLGVVYQGAYPDMRSQLAGIAIVDEEGLKYIQSISDLNNVEIVNISVNSVEGAVIRAIVLSKLGSSRVYTLVAGIDYGKSLGVAIVADSIVIYMNRHRSEKGVIDLVKLFFNNIEATKKIVRIGIPTTVIHKDFELFVDKLNKELPQEIIVEFISEYNTSKTATYEEKHLDKDSFAALTIAMKLHKIYEQR